MRLPALNIPGIIILLALSLPASGQKTDKVFLKNGDVVTGEIKSLKLAQLKFNMNGPGTISIKWEEIVSVISNKTFQVTLQSGSVLLTKLDTFFFRKQKVDLDDIVEIVQIKKKFVKRLQGNFNVGFNYTKSNDILQFNSNSSVTFRKPKMETNFKLNNVLSKSSDDTSISKKQDATLSYLRTLNKRFYLMGYLGWEQNTELGLVNRYLVSAGAGKILFNNNEERLLTGSGLSYSHEKFNDSSGYKGSVEALLKGEFKKFRYSSPKISIDAQYALYMGLSNWGRVRMMLQVNTSIEIFKDFSTGFTFYDNFDNRPSAKAASKNDFGITLSLGYEFGK